MKLTPDQFKAMCAKLGISPPESILEAMQQGDATVAVQALAVPHNADAGTIMPADAEQLAGLLEGARAEPFVVGDIVRLRPWAEDRFKWPRKGELCIVTQVLPAPYRHGDHNRAHAAAVCDIALGFVDPDGDIIEFLHDRRMFEKVGSVFKDRAA